MSLLPTISIIIPAHNQERYIGRCLRSVLNQTYARDNYEIIVIDDASSDRTDYALELFESEIVLIRNRRAAWVCRDQFKQRYSQSTGTVCHSAGWRRLCACGVSKCVWRCIWT